MDVWVKFNLIDLFHFECFSIKVSHIFIFFELIEIIHEEYELLIFAIVLKRRDGNPVSELGTKGKNSVVHDNHVLKFSILENSQVFYVHVICRLDTVIAVYTMLY
jgi:hypothetical protein